SARASAVRGDVQGIAVSPGKSEGKRKAITGKTDSGVMCTRIVSQRVIGIATVEIKFQSIYSARRLKAKTFRRRAGEKSIVDAQCDFLANEQATTGEGSNSRHRLSAIGEHAPRSSSSVDV